MSPLEQREGRSLWVMRGWVSGVVRVFVRVSVCEFFYVCVWCVRGEGVRVGDWMRGGCWNGMVEVSPG